MSLRSPLLLLVALFLLGVTVPSALRAQVAEADSAAVLLGTAEAFDRAGDEDVADALYRYLAERYGGTPAGSLALSRLATRGGPAGGEGSGRVELQVWGTTAGLFTGVAVPAAFGADGPEAYGVGLLVGGPIGLLATRAVARSRPLSTGQARAITWGGTWGAWQGLGWSDVLDLGEEEVCYLDDGVCYIEDSSEESFAAMLVGGALGTTTGYLISRGPVSAGTAAGANYGALWGSWLGVASAILLDLDESGRDDATMTTTLLAGNAGLVAGALLARSQEMSRNRVRLISVGGLIGGLGGAGLDLILQPDDENTIVAIPLVGSLAGLGLAAHLTRDHDRVAFGGGSGAGAAPSGRWSGSLLEFDGGRWRIDAPVPLPTVLSERGVGGRPNWVPGMAVGVLSARF